MCNQCLGRKLTSSRLDIYYGFQAIQCMKKMCELLVCIMRNFPSITFTLAWLLSPAKHLCLVAWALHLLRQHIDFGHGDHRLRWRKCNTRLVNPFPLSFPLTPMSPLSLRELASWFLLTQLRICYCLYMLSLSTTWHQANLLTDLAAERVLTLRQWRNSQLSNRPRSLCHNADSPCHWPFHGCVNCHIETSVVQFKE